MKKILLFALICLISLSEGILAQKPKSIDRFFTTSDDVKLHYRVSGKGKPLVIFPGYGQDVTKFNTIYPELEKHFTVYNLDYR